MTWRTVAAPDITVTCPTCSVEFTTRPNTKRMRFCSRACALSWVHDNRAKPTSAAEREERRRTQRLAAAVARNPELAARYGVVA